MKKNTEALKDLLLISPRDIKKGEEFTLFELFSTDNILKKYEEIINELSSAQTDEKMEKIKKDFSEEKIRFLSDKDKEYSLNLLEAKNELSKTFEEERQRAKKWTEEERTRNNKEYDEIIRREKSLIKNEKDSIIRELKNEKEKTQLLQETILEKKNIFENIREIYSKNLKDELIKSQLNMQKIHEENIVKLAQQYEDKSKSAYTIGADAENEIKEKLKMYFPQDGIINTNASIGEADILHKVMEQDKEVATIYYEIKNRKNWSKSNYDNFADKVRKEKHTFNIFISAELPKKSPEQHIKLFEGAQFLYDEINNIYIVTFTNWLPVVASLRNNAITINTLNNYSKNKESIQERVYDFFKSSEFRNYFSRIQNNLGKSKSHLDDIQKISIKSKAEIEKIWFELENLNIQLNLRFLNHDHSIEEKD